MMAMDQVPPDHIMIDQDQRLAIAISKVFPNLIHGCCFCHVLKSLRRKLGPKMVDGHPLSTPTYMA
jgi:hypothetical protein